MKNKKSIAVVVLVLTVFTVNAQYQRGQWGFGGEFSFINSRNSVSRSTTDFVDAKSNGFNTSLIAGKFTSGRTYLYGVADVEYTSVVRDLVVENLTNSTEQQSFSSFFTVQAGVGARRYYKVNEKNIVGFFVQGQVMVGNTWVSQQNYAEINDSVLSDINQKYPIRLLSVNVNPGVYVNITPKWQLTVNVGNLYFTQSVIPDFVDIGVSKRNSSFGLDVNLFDFRLGVLYTPKRE
jgi:hypothetical protein